MLSGRGFARHVRAQREGLTMSTASSLYLRTLGFGLLLIAGTCQLGCARGKAALDKDNPSVAALIDKLKKGDFIAKLDAMGELRKLGTEPKPAVPTLIKILEDDKAKISGAATGVEQGAIGRPEDANPSIRAAAIVTLEKIGPDAKPAIPVLLKSLKDKDNFVRLASISALLGIGEKEDGVLSAVKKMLEDSSPGVRMEAARVLVRFNSESKASVATVTSILQKDKDPGTRASAAFSLRSMMHSQQIKTAIPPLIKALNDSDKEVREAAAQVLGDICEEGKIVVPALVESVKQDKEESVRMFAAQALGEFGPEAQAAIPALTAALKDPTSDVQVAAAQSLDHIKTWKTKRGTKGKEEQYRRYKKKREELKKEQGIGEKT
jgi:HEAT repeat protein